MTSANFATAHDGFTLQYLVSFSEERNEANGKMNRDAHSANFSEAQALRHDTPVTCVAPQSVQLFARPTAQQEQS
ncbi:hypothetical protein OE699_05835 [Sedimentimonas flavescens]|uniref:Uncharacterized protein n=1 Tax=Sedimentimonas flavescens TaxID=2851012 RepID=A0ABT2ZXI9_9RHOB|nr:hypothetical protein [Sedimentimonas flavescens]MCV2878368.1 hypothetical protein [Sedimentimonas flavescens]